MNEKKIKSTKEDLYIYGVYTKILANEKHYTILQSNLKSTTAYWLLIIIGGLGVIYSSRETSMPFQPLMSTFILCFIGIVGVNVLCYEDVVIQERFLSLNHLEAFKLENIYQWLPQVHHRQMCFTHKNMIKLKILFYVGCTTILFIIFLVSVVLYLYRYGILLPIIVDLFLILIFIIFSRLMFMKAYRNEITTLKECVYVGK